VRLLRWSDVDLGRRAGDVAGRDR